MNSTNSIKAVQAASRPFVIYTDTDLTGTATGDPEVRSYCSLPSTSESRYRLDRPDHNQIFQFRLTQGGMTRYAYCLDKFADGPYNDVPYESAPFETIFPAATGKNRCLPGSWQIHFLLSLPDRRFSSQVQMLQLPRFSMITMLMRQSRSPFGYSSARLRQVR